MSGTKQQGASLEDVQAQVRQLQEVLNAYLESDAPDQEALAGVGVTLEALSRRVLVDGVPREHFSWTDAIQSLALTTSMTLGEAGAFMLMFRRTCEEVMGQDTLPMAFDLYPLLRDLVGSFEPGDQEDRRAAAMQRGRAAAVLVARGRLTDSEG
jgi:hypothetical protein